METLSQKLVNFIDGTKIGLQSIINIFKEINTLGEVPEGTELSDDEMDARNQKCDELKQVIRSNYEEFKERVETITAQVVQEVSTFDPIDAFKYRRMCLAKINELGPLNDELDSLDHRHRILR